MTAINYPEFSEKVREALRATFTDLLEANPARSFYAFAIWTDDSLQFANAAANTEEGLAATVDRYVDEVDPKYGTTSTRNSMRWAHGDWEFFPVEGKDYLAEVNAVLQENFNADEDLFEQQLEPLAQALLDGFRQLEAEGFFGAGEARAKITLLLVGDLDEEVVDHWVRTLNPPEVAQRFIDWDYDAPDAI